MIRSFPPIINSETEILIVGTMPSVKSLEAQQYYAHPRNAFWKIIAALYHQGAEFADFQEKKACLLANRLGLWDSLQLCLREGSLDSAITDEQPNDFNTLLAKYPAVRRSKVIRNAFFSSGGSRLAKASLSVITRISRALKVLQ